MDFFDDDFGLGTVNSYTRKPSSTSLQKGGSYGVSNSPRKSPKKDQAADQLYDLLNKDEKKNVKKSDRDLQPFSSTFIQPNQPLDFRKTQKWSTPNIQAQALYQPPKFANPINNRKNSLAESDEGRSFKSGANNKANAYELDNLITLRPIQSKDELPIIGASMRSMMKPPLRKKQSKEPAQQDYRQPSIVNQDQSVSNLRKYPETTGFLDFGSRTDLRPKNKQENGLGFQQRGVPLKKQQQVNFQLTKARNQEQNINLLKKKYEAEIKQIKQSYERQLKMVGEKLRQQIQESKRSRTKIINEYQQRIQQDKIRWKNILQQNEERIKKMYEWELSKKCEAYEMEIQKFKSMAKVENIFNNQQNQMQLNLEQAELKARQHQMDFQKKKLEDLKLYLEQREREVQYHESGFGNYRKKQEQAIQSKLRSLVQKQNQLRKQQMESKRAIAIQKQQMASQLADAQIQLMKKQQSLNLQKEQTKINKQLFERQKTEYSSFNKTLLNDYKAKIKQIQAQKSHLNELQMQIQNKLNTVQLAQHLKSPKDNAYRARATSRPSNNQQNYRNRTNTDFTARIKQTKDRFKQLQVLASKNYIQKLQERQGFKEAVNLSGYITRINKNMSKR